MVQLVRLCPSCEQVNCGADAERCVNCWGYLTGVKPVHPDLIRRSWRRRLIFLRRPGLVIFLALVAGLIAWRLVLLFQIIPALFPPPTPTTDLSPTLDAQTWSQVRRTPQNTGFTPDSPPRPGRIKWVFETSKPLHAGPSVSKDKVFLSTDDGLTVALDRESGNPIWEYRSNLPTSSTPAVAGKSVIIALRPGIVSSLAIDTGDLRWSIDLKGPIYASPVIADGSVYIGAGTDHLHALDLSTGEERWAFDAGEWIVASVAYTEQSVAVVTQFSDVFLVDPKTGRKRLYFDTGYVRFGGGPVILGNKVYISSDRGWFWAIDRDAKGLPFERILWKVKLNLFVWGLLDDKPLQKGGLWSHRLGGDLKFTSAASHDSIYVTNKQGQVFARDSSSGKPEWTVDLGVEVTTAPTVANKTVLVGTVDGRVVALESRTGDIVWEFEVGGSVTASPIAVGDTIYIVTSTGVLYAITGPG